MPQTQKWSRSGAIAYLKRVAAHACDLWLVIPPAAPRSFASDVLAVFWSPNGERIALERRAQDPSVRGLALFIFDVASGSGEPIANHGEFLGWSPDSRLVAYWRNPDGGSATNGEICVRDVSTGREFNLGIFSSDEGPQWAPDASTETFMNVRIDPATGATQELWPRTGNVPAVQPSAMIGWSPDLRSAHWR